MTKDEQDLKNLGILEYSNDTLSLMISIKSIYNGQLHILICAEKFMGYPRIPKFHNTLENHSMHSLQKKSI